jgi:FRG domain-containing protein
MKYTAVNLEEALLTAERLRSMGRVTWFRGQTRNWPLLSTFVRKTPTEQSAALERFARFWDWLQSVPALASIAADKDAALAVAQHYGLATNLIDFSTEPRVAAFFATHSPPPPHEGEDISCIICLNYDELRKLCDSVRLVRPNVPAARAINLEIPELWRIQAQRGVFLHYPFDASFEARIFDFDRIAFPTERDPGVLARLIPEEDIYPTQKSDLEVLLDQFFMLEMLAEGSRIIEDDSLFPKVYFEAPPDGVEAECFGPSGLPVHESWEPSRLAKWLSPEEEHWTPRSAAPNAIIRYPSTGDSPSKILAMKDEISATFAGHTKWRAGPVNWIVIDVPPVARLTARLTRWLELAWDGLRRWPYSSADVAQALATVMEYGLLVNGQPSAHHDVELARQLAERCFGGAMEIEIGIEDGSYARGFANRELLWQAVRQDFGNFLTDEWRPQIKRIGHVLQVASNPKRALVFDQLQSLFCTQIVPTQVVLRDETSKKARLYTLARATSIGLP